MIVWLVRGGRHGEKESIALDKNLAVIGWNALPDLGPIKKRESLRELLEKVYPNELPNVITNWLGQLWGFRNRMQIGDLAVLPLKGRSAIVIGEITGEYKYRPDLPEGTRHTRAVKWKYTDVPRSNFDEDLLASFNSRKTVGKIHKENAGERIIATAKGERIPAKDKATIDDETEPLFIDLEEMSRDQIRKFISAKFHGHNFARLVDEILKAKGYKTQISSPGPDGGVDIIAGKGPMGFDHPKLCVQVKSGGTPVDVKVLRELQGVMGNFGAEQGLLVSWAGFNNKVLSEARRIFFQIRLWESNDVISALIENYDNLSDDMQADLPLKKIWSIVPDEDKS